MGSFRPAQSHGDTHDTWLGALQMTDTAGEAHRSTKLNPPPYTTPRVLLLSLLPVCAGGCIGPEEGAVSAHALQQ